MRKAEPVDEFAKTEVLTHTDDLTGREPSALSLYAEYERELAHEVDVRRDSRARR